MSAGASPRAVEPGSGIPPPAPPVPFKPESAATDPWAADAQSSHALSTWDQNSFAFFAARDWRPEGQALLLAVSGGLDSTVLLDFFARHAGPLRLRLIVAHVNHGLRQDSDLDQAFVAEQCRLWGLSLRVLRLNPQAKPARESTEMWARRERYRFFQTLQTELAADAVLTAHHRDDVVETVFQRLARGTGPLGLSGIPFRRAPGIVRPFLNRARAEILDYARLRGLPWREDESNADAAIDRNWYRLRYLPGLRAQDPDLDARVLKIALDLQDLRRGLEALEAEETLLREDATGRSFLDREGMEARLRAGDLEALRFWLRRLVRSSHPDTLQVTWEILHELRRQWWKNPRRVGVSLTPGWVLKSENTGFYCVEMASGSQSGRSREKKDGIGESRLVILEAAGGGLSWRWDDRVFTLSARRYPRPMELAFPGASESRAIFDADSFSCTLQVRTRKAGDRFSPFGIDSRSRKLKAFFNEKKVPVAMRDNIPIVLAPCRAPAGGTHEEVVAWVPGFGVSDRFKVTANTTSILELVLTCQNP